MTRMKTPLYEREKQKDRQFESRTETVTHVVTKQSPAPDMTKRYGSAESLQTKNIRNGSAGKTPLAFLSFEDKLFSKMEQLAHHLELDGYLCCESNEILDLQKAFDMVDSVKVVILCLSLSYSESACLQHATHAMKKGKPVIPLCFERIAWPPGKDLGKVLEETKFLRFYKSSGDKTKIKSAVFWPEKSFRELSDWLREITRPNKRLRFSAIKQRSLERIE